MKKQILSIIAVLLLVFSLFSCEKGDVVETEAPVYTENEPVQTSTLLVYMVGSDLEGRAAAATNDLAEMEASGIDLSHTNVVVCAGGSQYWHGVDAAVDRITVLELSGEGFSRVHDMPLASMGEAETLCSFLNYGYESYPSDSYSLIMWNHGNGPVIGYGKDMLFDGDSLTLSEMKKALEASHFCGEEKLEFVGFDACLMASAELACTWKEHASYLIASQEIEPAPGWNYAFLKDFGKTDAKTLAASIIDTYMQSCCEYYEKKGFEDRDTTLSCLDLSVADELETALDRLFSKASAEVVERYNTFASKRVDTRALGRASTGSEYDLVDIGDMADKLYDVYPDEAAALKEVLEKLVVANGSNTEGCCGLSFYYPFYNKYYYQNSWSEAYFDLALFESYGEYLGNYQSIWLSSDKLESFAASIMPMVKEPTKYTLRLTEEQNASLADVKYYVLESVGDELYHSVFSSHNITNEGGLLTANFGGEVIYARNKFNEYILPVVTEYDTVGDITRYSVSSASLKKAEKEAEPEIAFFQLAVNNKTKDIGISAILPSLSSVDEYYLMGGKNEDLSLDDYAEVTLYHFFYSYLTRYENGVVRPLDEWTENPMATGWDINVKDGFEFVFAPLLDGQYYLVFEMTDTQGNKYCSELLPIEVDGGEKEVYKPEDISVTWVDGDRVKIAEADGVFVYLKKAEKYGEPMYLVEVENTAEFPVNVRVKDVVLNGDVFVGFGGSVDADAKQTASDSLFGYIDFNTEVSLGVLDEIKSVECTVNIVSDDSWSASFSTSPAFYTLMYDQRVNITVSDGAKYSDLGNVFAKFDFTEPFLGALAEEQLLYGDEEMQISLLGFGNGGYNSGKGYFCFENLSAEPICIDIGCMAVNGITMLGNRSIVGDLPSGCKCYELLDISEYSLKKKDIEEIESIDIMFNIAGSTESLYLSDTQKHMWLSVKLSQHGNAKPTVFFGEEIFNKNGVRILYTGIGEAYGKTAWNVTVINDSDETVQLLLTDAAGKNAKASLDSRVVGPHQYVNTYIYASDGAKDSSIAVVFNVLNYSRTKVLATADEETVLYEK